MSNNTVIRFTSTMKPDGEEYKKVAYWNRFLRVKIETLVLILLVITSIGSAVFRLTTNTMDTFWAIVSIVFLFYPWLVITQFNTSIRYHLKHREPSETAPCEFTIMENGVLMDVPECEVQKMYHYTDFTHVYTDVFGYFICFNKSKLLVMIKYSDVPADRIEDMKMMIGNGLSHDCKVSKFM